MTVKKKFSAAAISVWTGAILGVLALGAYATGLLDKRIDYRIDCKILRSLLIIEEMASPEEKQRADERYKLITNK